MEIFFVFFTLFVVLLGCGKFISFRRTKHSANFLNRKLPVIKWTTPYLPFINGFVTLVKTRTEGAKVGDIFRSYGLSSQLDMPFVKTITTCDPNLLQKILSSTSPGHLNKPWKIYQALFTDYLKNGLLVSDVSVWTPHRKAVSRAFTYKSFPNYLRFINTGAENIVKSACAIASNNCDGILGNADMKYLIDHHAVKIIIQILMGSESFNYSDEEIDEFHENFQRGKEITLNRFLHPMQLIPLIWKFHPNKRKLDYHVGELTKFSYKVIDKYRLKDLTRVEENVKEQQRKVVTSEGMDNSCHVIENGTKEDLGLKPFECMIEQMIKAGFNNEEITDEVNTLLATGHETILCALDMLIFHLATNLEHQEICRSEVDKFFNSEKNKTTNEFNLQDVSKLEYLERCILETLRITPVIPFFIRQLDIPLEVENDSFIEAGLSVLVNVWSLHRNQDIYLNPTKFDPDRFLSENVKKRHPFAFMPFSYGPRNCLGYKLAVLETKVIMAWILGHFEITTTDKLDDVKLLFDVTLKPERMYNISFKKRDEI